MVDGVIGQIMKHAVLHAEVDLRNEQDLVPIQNHNMMELIVLEHLRNLKYVEQLHAQFMQNGRNGDLGVLAQRHAIKESKNDQEFVQEQNMVGKQHVQEMLSILKIVMSVYDAHIIRHITQTVYVKAGK